MIINPFKMLLFVSLFFTGFIIYLVWTRKLTAEFKLKKGKRILISVEGNIGVGKSSLVTLLKNKLQDVEFIKEPVDEWHTIVDEEGKDILQTFYDDKKRWSYTFQNIGYITRMNHIVDRIKNYNKKYIIIDRSLDADLNTFAQMLYDGGYINEIEWNAYNRWNNFFVRFFGHKIDHKIIYLRCDPQIAFNRTQIRSRDAEKGVPIDYLQSLHQYHDRWLLEKDNVLVIDVNDDFVNDQEKFNSMYKSITDFIY